MGLIKKEIKVAIKLAGSKMEARKQAMEWYTKSLKDFNAKDVVKRPNRFTPGKIYVFRYDTPKYEKELPWWDRNPVVLALDPVDGNDCGINLNLLPVYVKETLLDDVHTRLNGQIKTAITRGGGNALNQRGLSLSYKGAKAYLDRYGFGFAVRQYIPSLKRKQAIVNYENWTNIILCEFAELEGVPPGRVKYLFRKYYNNKNI
jgi:hypothetical protein